MKNNLFVGPDVCNYLHLGADVYSHSCIQHLLGFGSFGALCLQGSFCSCKGGQYATLSITYKSAAQQLILRGTAYPPTAVGFLFREEWWRSLVLTYNSPTGEELRKKTHAKVSTVAEKGRLSILLTLSVHIFEHPKSPTVKRANPSE